MSLPGGGGSAFGREAALLLTAVQFLTRLPVPDPGWEEGRMRAALRYFGAVGAGVGLASAGVWLAACAVLPAPVAAGLALAAALALTGALHEDGLADCADGLGGAADRDGAMEIMRDSRLGSYGAVALVVTLGLRWAALASFGPSAGAAALVLSMSAGRALMVPASAASRPARADGLAAALGGGARPFDVLAALAIPVAIGAALGWPALLAIGIGAAAAAFCLWRALRRLGGYTGDVLGAVAAVAETAVLVAMAGADP